MSFLRKRIKSFKHAFSGIGNMFNGEPNFLLHTIAFFLVIITGFYFSISKNEWLAILLVSALVLTLEMINSALEKLCDFIEPNQHQSIKKIKDIAAGAVLISALFAIVIALIIFLPYFF